MKRNGFTLIEMLVTLGIIGVVAALTMPALVQNTGEAKIGPKLAKVVNSFETSCGQMMLDKQITTLYDLEDETVATALGNELIKYIVMTPLKDNVINSYRYYSPDGSASKTINRPAYILNDGSMIALIGDEDAYSQTGSFLGADSYLIVDIDGPSGNNRAGKEVFAFYIDNSGILIPFGSKQLKKIKESLYTNCSLKSSSIPAGLACTGKIADAGWKS